MSEAYDNERSAGSSRAGRVSRMKAERPAARKRGKNRKQEKDRKKAPRKATMVRSEITDRPWRGLLLGVVLLAVCVVLGAQSATQSQRMRTLYSQLQQDALAKDSLLAQQSRLLIERGALKSYNNVDRLAEDELNMRFPESITRVTRKGGK